MAKAKKELNTLATGQKKRIRAERVPFMMLKAELDAFDAAIAKANPMVGSAGIRSKILRMLVQKFVEEQKVPWPEEKNS